MTLSGINASAYDLNVLTAQISESVRNIRATSLQSTVFSQAETPAFENRQPVFSLNGFAVSYLEPQALYSLQKMVSEAPEELNREGQKHRLKPDIDNDDGKAAKASNPEEINSLNFNSELERGFSASDYAKVTAVYRRAVQVNVPEVTLLFGGTPVSEDPARYAAEAYNAAADLNRSKEPLIELMHMNNRNFDYKI